MNDLVSNHVYRLGPFAWVLHAILLLLLAESVLNYASTSAAGVWVLGLLIVAFVLLVAWPAFRLPLPLIPLDLWAALCLLLWVGVQWATHDSVYIQGTAAGFHTLAGYGLLLLTTFLVFHWYGRQAEVGYALLVFGLAVAVFGVAQHLAAPLYIYGIHTPPDAVPFASFINRDDFAAFAELLIPTGLILGIWGKRDIRSATALIAAAFLILAVLASGSRAGILMVLLELTVVVLVRIRSGWRALVWTSILTAAVAAVGWRIFPQNFHRLALLLRAPTQDESFRTRWLVDLDTWHMWRAHLWTGVGWGGFPSAFPQFQTYYSRFFMNAAHNEYLQLAAEAGVVGLLPVLLWLFLFLRRGARRWRRFRLDPRRFEPQVMLGIWIGMAAFLVHCGVEFLMHIPALAALFFVLWAAQLQPPSSRRIALRKAAPATAVPPRVTSMPVPAGDRSAG